MTGPIETLASVPGRLARKVNGRAPARAARLRGRLGFLFPVYEGLIRLKTREPVEFRHKVEFKMARDRRPLLQTFADKLEVRRYVDQVLGPGYTPEVLANALKAGDLPWEDLPAEVAFKVNHGSGGGVILREDATATARVPDAVITNAWKDSIAVRPGNVQSGSVAALLDMHLGLNYYWVFGEWAYREIRRCAFAEEVVRGPDGGNPLEYRCYTFDGKCEVIIAGTALTDPNPPMDVFLADWTVVDATRPGTRRHEILPGRPAFLGEMVEVAETLGRETDFVRVDFLASEERFWVGELTSYPYGGRVPLEPPERERWLGDFWTLPSDYSSLPQGSYPLPPLDSVA